MAPRQRLSTQMTSSESVEHTSAEDSPRLLPVSSSSSSSSSSENNSKSLLKKATSTSSSPTEADIARDHHDYFNLVALLFIIYSTGLNYDLTKIAEFQGMHSSWTGDYFWENWLTTFVYFIVDLVWVAVVPTCVKSPQVIMKHHCVAVLYLMAPVYFPEFRWFMGSVLSVEVNTWFLILRRVVYKTDLHIPPLISEVVSALFYVTWILIRCVIYPGVLLTFCQMAQDEIRTSGTVFHLPMVFIPIHFFLCVLNLKWTYDLFKPIFVRWFSGSSQQSLVQKGL